MIALQGSPDSGVGMLMLQLTQKRDLTNAGYLASSGLDLAMWKSDEDSQRQNRLNIMRLTEGMEWKYVERGLRRLHKRAGGVIFMIDATSNSKWMKDGTGIEELTDVLNAEHAQGLPLLLLANKQDSVDAMSLEEVRKRLNLSEIKGREWHRRGCSALLGDGVKEGLQWLAARAKPRVVLSDTPDASPGSSAISSDTTI